MQQYQQFARNTTRTLFASQSFGSAGFVTSATINTIVGAQLSGHATWAGIPTSIYLLGSAFAAVGWSYLMERVGRRLGLTLGLLLGMLGALIAGSAVLLHSFGVLLVGLALMGAALAALQLSRFAAAEVHPQAERGRAISNVVLGSTIGSVLGPLMVGLAGRGARSFGFDELAGPYFLSVTMFACAAVIIILRLRPDPRDIGREVARLEAGDKGQPLAARPLHVIARQPGAVVAVGAMVFGQLTMVMLMVITSLHMNNHHHPLASISLVISSHTFGMYAFSILSGRLSDKLGRIPVIMIGAGTLIAACLIAPLSPQVFPIAVALFLLGFGWNFCFVGGSSLLSDQLTPAERPKVQGVNDLLIGLVSAFGSLGSGVIFGALGYTMIGVIGALASLVPLLLASWWRLIRRQTAMPQETERPA